MVLKKYIFQKFHYGRISRYSVIVITPEIITSVHNAECRVKYGECPKTILSAELKKFFLIESTDRRRARCM